MRSVLLSFACLSLAAPAAFADQVGYTPPVSSAARPIPERVGLELGLGLQAGEVACSSTGDFCNGFTEAGGLNLGVAYFPSPRFGIALDLWGMSHPENDFTFTHYVNTIGVKWRPARFLTLSGGIGEAHAALDFEMAGLRAESQDAFAIMGAVSLDLLRGRHAALSLEARVGKGFYRETTDDSTVKVIGRNSGIGLGLTFFNF